MISQVGFVGPVVIRSEAPGLSVLLLKPAFDDSFRFKRLRGGVTKQKLKNILILPIRKQMISQVGFVGPVVIRSEAPGLSVLLLKPAFDDSFRFKRLSALPHAWLRGKVIE